MILKKFQLKFRIMDCIESFSFGDGFRLEVGRDAPGRKVLKLFHNNRLVKSAKLLGPTLELLHYMVQRPQQELLDGDILDKFWPNSDRQIVDQHVHYLRVALNNDDPKDPRFIKTLHGRGYKWLLEVKREGGPVEAYQKWDRARFYALMRDLKRGPVGDTEDLRIVASAIGAGLDEMDFKGLLRKGVRIKVLILNPENTALTHARYSLRKDKLPSRCLRELNEEVADLQHYEKQFPPHGVDETSERGSLELGLSDIMPCGFVVHTRDWAVLGVYPAHDSFLGGPMIEMHSKSDAWETLHTDFKERWQDFLDKQASRRPTDA